MIDLKKLRTTWHRFENAAKAKITVDIGRELDEQRRELLSEQEDTAPNKRISKEMGQASASARAC